MFMPVCNGCMCEWSLGVASLSTVHSRYPAWCRIMAEKYCIWVSNVQIWRHWKSYHESDITCWRNA